jgi:large subunit ribosomal protein L5
MSTTKMMSVKEKVDNSFDAMKGEFGYTNVMAAPKVQKVIISTGTGGLMKKDRNKNDFIVDRLGKITGQKPSVKKAKKSVASFKIRTGDPVGVMVTLRGKTMYNFLEKLLNIALPRTKDFRGLDDKMVDNIGNVTIPVREHTIFPETADEELKDVFGMGITIVTTAKTKKEATYFFNYLGVPFKK